MIPIRAELHSLHHDLLIHLSQMMQKGHQIKLSGGVSHSQLSDWKKRAHKDLDIVVGYRSFFALRSKLESLGWQVLKQNFSGSWIQWRHSKEPQRGLDTFLLKQEPDRGDWIYLAGDSLFVEFDPPTYHCHYTFYRLRWPPNYWEMVTTMSLEGHPISAISYDEMKLLSKLETSFGKMVAQELERQQLLKLPGRKVLIHQEALEMPVLENTVQTFLSPQEPTPEVAQKLEQLQQQFPLLKENPQRWCFIDDRQSLKHRQQPIWVDATLFRALYHQLPLKGFELQAVQESVVHLAQPSDPDQISLVLFPTDQNHLLSIWNHPLSPTLLLETDWSCLMPLSHQKVLTIHPAYQKSFWQHLTNSQNYHSRAKTHQAKVNCYQLQTS